MNHAPAAKTFKHDREDSHQLHVHRLEGGREYEVEHLDPNGSLLNAGTVDWGEIDAVVESWLSEAEHDCSDWAGPVTTDGPLGHGWACGKCGAFLQAG